MLQLKKKNDYVMNLLNYKMILMLNYNLLIHWNVVNNVLFQLKQNMKRKCQIY